MSDGFVRRARHVSALDTVTVGVALNVEAVTFTSTLAWSGAMSPEDARWLAAALIQAADHVEGGRS